MKCIMMGFTVLSLVHMSAYKALAYDTPFVSQVNPNVLLNPGHPMYVLRGSDDQSPFAFHGIATGFPKSEIEMKAYHLIMKIHLLNQNEQKDIDEPVLAFDEEPVPATVENNSVIQAIVQP